MKLNYKRVLLVGMAFFLISAFWQAYDAIIPLILTNHFGLKQSMSGAVMSMDNVLAVFMLPIFGAFSDKVSTKYGKRKPFIFVGTIIAVISFICLTFIDNYQLMKIVNDVPEASKAAALAVMKNPSLFVGSIAAQGITDDLILEKTFEFTLSNPLPIIGFIVTLLLVLLAMATFRSPAVALMPDVTVKPLRSKANAIINLTGTAGGIIVLGLGMVFATSKNHYMQYTGYIMAVCAVMLIGFIVFMLFVKENKWAKEMEEDTKKYKLEDEPQAEGEKRKLSKPELKSLLLILASVALWYIGYNSITSKYSVYATNILHFDFNFTLIVAQAAAIVSYIPVGIVATKIGRRKTILAGVLMLASAFAIGLLITPTTPQFIMYPVFALAGIGWATINVNSFPMVVELAKTGDVGKYTGYYYTASMSAQIIAPIISGFLYDGLGMRYTFFSFGAIFVIFSFVTMFFVKHGDAKPAQKKDLLEQLDVED